MDDLKADQDIVLMKGCVRALATVGIYYPREALSTLQELGAFLRSEPELMEETRATVRTIKVFNATQVQEFLRWQADGVWAEYEPGQLVGQDLEQLLSLTQWIANLNFFYQASRFPFLRCLMIGSILGLTAEERNAERVVKALSQILGDTLVEKQFELESLLYDPVEEPESIVKKIAGKGYYCP
jgi:hypothetical protein